MTLGAGARLGPYEIVAPLGAGGMGEVYRAKDSRLNRTVAIKVLAEDAANDSDRRERFEREAKAISALDHPNICPLYDVGDHQGTYFLVMPCLEGETLADRLTRGPVPVDQAIKTAIEIATALDVAHRHGIIHRDLKPGNIMLTKAGVKLLDFGLAKLKKAEGPLGETTMVKGTGVGTLLGTMPYMSPEQIEGRDVDARSDIFSFGAVIYELITGERAFKGDTAASVIGAIMKDQPPPITSRQPLTPAALDHVVATCLEKDPEERWQSAADIARELKWIAHAPLAPTTAQPRTMRRSWLPAALGAVGGAAKVAAASIGLPRA
ncbi:MAG TPA: serine/threonine-protein kinase, partial [Vicinamibacterales bacterium]